MEGAACRRAGGGKETEEGAACSSVKLPGFRFHPTDEELVSFYLRKRVQQQQGEKGHALLALQCLIPDLDIYKYNPWDLPQLSKLGEGHSGCYFFSPRDRKYRNSSRPNRVTRLGFWKATGTDRPVHSSGSPLHCIGLKKSLVFYLGKASRGTKTDWMMHEFRLPNQPDHSEKDTCWTLCKIFKRKPSNSQCMSETQACMLEDLPGMREANADKFEALGSLGGEDCSEADSKSENTTHTSVEEGHMPSSVDIYTPPSCTSQDEFSMNCLVKSSESTESVALFSRQTEPLTLRLSKSFNGWADELGTSWVSPAIMKPFDNIRASGGGQPCVGDMSLPLTDQALQEPLHVLTTDCLFFSPQWNALLPLWDQPAYFQDPLTYNMSS